jgi:predicted nucleic acid-binding protein
MKKKKVLDSFAILAYLKREGKYKKVKDLLVSEEVFLLMNEINVGETFYILARERGLEKAEYFVNMILPSLPIETVPNTLDDVIEAARIKTTHSISYADCFVVATASRENAAIITGDPEFKKVQKAVEIEWMV